MAGTWDGDLFIARLNLRNTERVSTYCPKLPTTNLALKTLLQYRDPTGLEWVEWYRVQPCNKMAISSGLHRALEAGRYSSHTPGHPSAGLLADRMGRPTQDTVFRCPILTRAPTVVEESCSVARRQSRTGVDALRLRMALSGLPR